MSSICAVRSSSLLTSVGRSGGSGREPVSVFGVLWVVKRTLPSVKSASRDGWAGNLFDAQLPNGLGALPTRGHDGDRKGVNGLVLCWPPLRTRESPAAVPGPRVTPKFASRTAHTGYSATPNVATTPRPNRLRASPCAIRGTALQNGARRALCCDRERSDRRTRRGWLVWFSPGSISDARRSETFGSTMHIRMTLQCRAAINGFSCATLMVGRVYDVKDPIAAFLVATGGAEPCREPQSAAGSFDDNSANSTPYWP